MGWFDRHLTKFLGLIGLGLAAVLVKQGVAIWRHGVGGWLSGEGRYQTEWEVIAVFGLLGVLVPTVLLAGVLRASERPWQRLKEWHLERAIRRDRGGS